MSGINIFVYTIFVLMLIFLFIKIRRKQILFVAFIGISIIILKVDAFESLGILFNTIWAILTVIACIISGVYIINQKD